MLDDAHETVELFVNDDFAGRCICPPYRFDVTDMIKPGKNKLKLISATTLENAVNVLNRKVKDPAASFMARLSASPAVQPYGIQGLIKMSVEKI